MTAAKTISGHYGPVFSLAHNNRLIISGNVDTNRTHNNDNLVVAGGPIPAGYQMLPDMSQLWAEYKRVTAAYWEGRQIEIEPLLRRLRKLEKEQRKYEWLCRMINHGFSVPLLLALLFPILLLFCFGAYIPDIRIEYSPEYQELQQELLKMQENKDEFSRLQRATRLALQRHDRTNGTALLERLDGAVSAAEIASRFVFLQPMRYATIEEIYDKLYEPGYREFQEKQRKCRRYNGTYLESSREKQAKSVRKGKGSRNKSSAEAVEIIFQVGDMHDTGYAAAPDDAAQAEALLRDFQRHLLIQPDICVVTDAELMNPDWVPPFKHGLILVNLVLHTDEATPGIHMTVIPYTSGCKRGPTVQPSLGRALTGMGYPSTWIDKVDENGEPVPLRNRAGEIMYNDDGTVRIQKVPEKQGIIDWIEKQKLWIARQMKKRYDWDRVYKGSHPRGYLIPAEYRIAKDLERLDALDAKISQRKAEGQESIKRVAQAVASVVDEQQAQLRESIDVISATEPWRIAAYGLKSMPCEAYKRLYDKGREYLLRLPLDTARQALGLDAKIKIAEKRMGQPANGNAPNKGYHR